jgi:hypothetical protein
MVAIMLSEWARQSCRAEQVQTRMIFVDGRSVQTGNQPNCSHATLVGYLSCMHHSGCNVVASFLFDWYQRMGVW